MHVLHPAPGSIESLDIRVLAHRANVPLQWIGVGVLCMVGVATVYGVTATRQKDTPS